MDRSLSLPFDLLEKMINEDWSAEDLALEHAARLSLENYEPFSLSLNELRLLRKRGESEATNG